MDVVVIGAGVMGAMIAQRLSAEGRSVAILDRRQPATGATAASTALVMWGADLPLTQLAQAIGGDEAARRWRHLYVAVGALDQHIRALGLECGWQARPELYLAGDVLDRDALVDEGQARRAADLPSQFLDAEAVHARFGIAARSALISSGCFEVDPVALTLGILEAAQAQGASLCFPYEVERLASEDGGVRVSTAETSVLAGQVVLASGYEAARLFLPEHFSLCSSFAIATAPGAAVSWQEHALIWEASEPYLYTRATVDGRIIVGGEDETFDDPNKRDGMIAVKRAALETKAAALLQRSDLQFEYAWAATFGASPDGLPAIGPARNVENVYLAYGFGGNGVTFAALGADIIAAIFRGEPNDAAQCFDPYRAMPAV